MAQHIVIAGGSFVGLALAIGLAEQGIGVTVLEKQAQTQQALPAYDGRVSAIALGTQRFLQQLRIWPQVAEAQPIWDIRITDAQLDKGDSPLQLHYDHRDVGREPFGWIVGNLQLLRACWQRLEQLSGVTVVYGRSVDRWQVTDAGVQVWDDAGTAYHGALLIAADGRISGLRDKAGITAEVRPYGQTALVGCVTHPQPHHGWAVERFFAAGPFAMLPMTDDMEGNPRTAYVWTEPDAMAQGFLRLSEADYTAELNRRFDGVFGTVQPVGGRWGYPLTLVRTRSLTAPRFALAGDAAHGIHPIAGQGVNLGLRGAESLLKRLTEAASCGLDMGSEAVLADYAKARHFDVASMTDVTDALVHLFSNANPLVRAARRLGLGMVEQLPPLKRPLMRHAMGVLFPVG